MAPHIQAISDWCYVRVIRLLWFAGPLAGCSDSLQRRLQSVPLLVLDFSSRGSDLHTTVSQLPC